MAHLHSGRVTRTLWLAAAIGLSSAVSAQADIVLNTMGADQAGFGSYILADNSGGFPQSLAIPFTVGWAQNVTTIAAKIDLDFLFGPSGGEVELGIMSDADGVPSGTFLAVRDFDFSPDEFGGALFVYDLVITARDLAVPVVPGVTYWLAAVASDGFYGGWVFNSDLTGTSAFNNGDPSDPAMWFPSLDQPLEQAIVGTPEPISLALFGVGLLGLGLARGRR